LLTAGALTTRETELRNALLNAEQSDRIGEEWIAEITQRKSNRLDSAALKKHFGMEALQPFMQESVTKSIRLISVQTGKRRLHRTQKRATFVPQRNGHARWNQQPKSGSPKSQIALLMRAYPNCNLDQLTEVSFEFDQAGKVIDCIGTIKDGGNIDHDYAGAGLARLYERARRQLTARQTRATILQFPNGERPANAEALPVST
jgi:hypothetical protein